MGSISRTGSRIVATNAIAAKGGRSTEILGAVTRIFSAVDACECSAATVGSTSCFRSSAAKNADRWCQAKPEKSWKSRGSTPGGKIAGVGNEPVEVEVLDKEGHPVKRDYPNLPAPVRGVIWIAAACFAVGIFLMALVIAGLQATRKALKGGTDEQNR